MDAKRSHSSGDRTAQWVQAQVRAPSTLYSDRSSRSSKAISISNTTDTATSAGSSKRHSPKKPNPLSDTTSPHNTLKRKPAMSSIVSPTSAPTSNHSHRSRTNAHINTAAGSRQPPRIPSSVYQSPMLPAFVQGPPGSGYPMPLATVNMARKPAHVPSPHPPSPPPDLPTLNPKKSRPIARKRRPSLSEVNFDSEVARLKAGLERHASDPHAPRRRAMSESDPRFNTFRG